MSNQFTIAASFGNVHGVYKPGNVKLHPAILKNSQDYIEKNLKTEANRSTLYSMVVLVPPRKKSVRLISYGVIKMNIDTDSICN